MIKTRKKHLTLIICIFLSIFITSLASGQRRGLKDGGGMGYFMMGGGFLDIDALKSTLKDHGYWEPTNFSISLGGGGHAIVGKLIIGGEGHSILGDRVTSGDTKTAIYGGYGMFNLGYIVHSTKTFRLYPLLGLGGGGLTFEILDTGGSPTFGDLLDHPTRSVEMSTGGFMASFALGFDYLVVFEETEEGVGGLVFGLRAGYSLALTKSDWQMDELNISGGPEIGITGPFIRLLIGGGGHGRKK